VTARHLPEYELLTYQHKVVAVLFQPGPLSLSFDTPQTHATAMEESFLNWHAVFRVHFLPALHAVHDVLHIEMHISTRWVESQPFVLAHRQ